MGHRLSMDKFGPLEEEDAVDTLLEEDAAGRKTTKGQGRENIQARSAARVSLTVVGMCLFALRLRSRLAAPPVCKACLSPETNEAAGCVTKIPRIIHQSYKSHDLPTRWRGTPEAWRAHHPGYEYMFWTDKDNLELIRQKYPWFLDTYNAYPYPIQRADAARYFVVLTYGGVYVDLDVQPMRDISPLLCKVDSNVEQILVAETPNMGLTNAFFAAVPQSKTLSGWVHQLPSLANPWLGRFSPHFEVMLSAGSTRYWRHMATEANQSTVVRLPLAEWGACSLCSSSCPTQPGAFFVHGRGNSWHGVETKVLNWISCHPSCLVWVVVCMVVCAAVTMLEKQASHSEGSADTKPLGPALGATKTICAALVSLLALVSLPDAIGFGVMLFVLAV